MTHEKRTPEQELLAAATRWLYDDSRQIWLSDELVVRMPDPGPKHRAPILPSVASARQLSWFGVPGPQLIDYLLRAVAENLDPSFMPIKSREVPRSQAPKSTYREFDECRSRNPPNLDGEYIEWHRSAFIHDDRSRRLRIAPWRLEDIAVDHPDDIPMVEKLDAEIRQHPGFTAISGKHADEKNDRYLAEHIETLSLSDGTALAPSYLSALENKAQRLAALECARQKVEKTKKGSAKVNAFARVTRKQYGEVWREFIATMDARVIERSERCNVSLCKPFRMYGEDDAEEEKQRRKNESIDLSDPMVQRQIANRVLDDPSLALAMHLDRLSDQVLDSTWRVLEAERLSAKWAADERIERGMVKVNNRVKNLNRNTRKILVGEQVGVTSSGLEFRITATSNLGDGRRWRGAARKRKLIELADRWSAERGKSGSRIRPDAWFTGPSRGSTKWERLSETDRQKIREEAWEKAGYTLNKDGTLRENWVAPDVVCYQLGGRGAAWRAKVDGGLADLRDKLWALEASAYEEQEESYRWYPTVQRFVPPGGYVVSAKEMIYLIHPDPDEALQATRAVAAEHGCKPNDVIWVRKTEMPPPRKPFVWHTARDQAPAASYQPDQHEGRVKLDNGKLVSRPHELDSQSIKARKGAVTTYRDDLHSLEPRQPFTPHVELWHAFPPLPGGEQPHPPSMYDRNLIAEHLADKNAGTRSLAYGIQWTGRVLTSQDANAGLEVKGQTWAVRRLSRLVWDRQVIMRTGARQTPGDRALEIVLGGLNASTDHTRVTGVEGRRPPAPSCEDDELPEN